MVEVVVVVEQEEEGRRDGGELPAAGSSSSGSKCLVSQTWLIEQSRQRKSRLINPRREATVPQQTEKQLISGVAAFHPQQHSEHTSRFQMTLFELWTTFENSLALGVRSFLWTVTHTQSGGL
jgi:hypothetical protein